MRTELTQVEKNTIVTVHLKGQPEEKVKGWIDFHDPRRGTEGMILLNTYHGRQVFFLDEVELIPHVWQTRVSRVYMWFVDVYNYLSKSSPNGEAATDEEGR